MSKQAGMKALVVRQLGNPVPSPTEKRPYAVSADHPTPQYLAPNAVRIKVAASGLNFADALQVMGQYQVKPKLPFIPGSEVSGKVIEIGRDVRTLAVGDSVCAVTQGGGFAGEVVIKQGGVVKLPDHVDLIAAAGLPVIFGTAHLAIKERAQVKAGQTVLILGAAGGVGVAAVQICKVLGAKVVAVARGESKAKLLTELGADAVIDTSANHQGGGAAPGRQPAPEDEGYGALGGPGAQNQGPALRDLIKKAAPDGVDVIFDPVGGTPFAEALKTLKWGGQIAIIGFASGTIPKIAANIALVKNWTIHGIFWGAHQQAQPRVFRRTLEESVQWLSEGKVRVPVSHKFPLEQASDAFKALLSRQVIGKILLVPDSGAQSKL